MYPDPITPRSFPELLAKLDYDPFHVMPGEFPPAPRVFTTADRIARARGRVAAGSRVDVHCFEQLILSCKLDEPLPALPETSGSPDWGGPLVPWLDLAFRNALAWSLTDDERHRQRALEAMRLAAHAVSQVPKWTGHEHHEAEAAARAYDLLAAGGLEPADDNAFRGMLWTFIEALDCGDHRTCNNHNAMHMVARLAIGAALGHRQTIHDTFYGHLRGGLPWRYGLIHTLRHDFLADGMQWEGAPGYHMLVLMMVCECFTIMENLGVDLWQRGWPSTMQDDGYDEHRGWGPKGLKPLTAAFDALIYQAFPNGDYSLLHDQVLGNLRGAWVWWRLFNKAYEVYGDPRYAWVLKHINRSVPATVDGQVPVWFEGSHGSTEFARMEGRDFPAGEHPLVEDRQLSLTGRHAAGCSLFPMHGSAILRSDPVDERALGAYLYWGPHWAGHRSPAALHLDIHALGRRAVTAPHLFTGGYDDPRHLTWLRATIAYNTVSVDEQPMFPYDFDTDSLWECDRWRDTISDGVLESFQHGTEFKAIRVSNDNVYAGVRLDRTVVLTGGYLLDVYRVSAEEPRLLDWAMHCQGVFEQAAGETVDLGQNRGYRHFTDSRRLPQQSGWATVPFTLDGTPSRCAVWLDGAPGARLILARDPEVDKRAPIGDLHPPEPRTSLIVRSRAASALFVSIWSFGEAAEGGVVLGKADEDVTVEVRGNGQTQRWLLPLKGDVQKG